MIANVGLHSWYPVKESATEPKATVEVLLLNTTGGSVGGGIERVCSQDELIISTWLRIHLRERLKELYCTCPASKKRKVVAPPSPG